MYGKRIGATFAAVATFVVALMVGAAPAATQTYADELAARIWLDRGDQPLLQLGDEVRLYYQASRDAHVAVFHIDTNGTARMLLPRTPDDAAYVMAGRDYRLVFPESSFWVVDEDPGKGYFFVVASPTPMDFSSFGWDPWGRVWELGEVGRQIYSDPYVAMDEIVAVLIPDWEYAPYALDFVEYDVGGTHDYPRFLCYDCHGFRPYQVWNPYLYTCSTFRVVIWDDPYFYPARRYVGRSVVWTRPAAPYQPRFTFKERARGEPAVPLVRPSTARVGPTNRVTGQPGRLQRGSLGDDGMVRVPSAERGRIQYRPGGRGTAAPNRPSAVLPGRAGAAGTGRAVPGSPTARGGSVGRTPAPGNRPSLQRRSGGQGGAATRATPPAGGRTGGSTPSRVVPPRRTGGGGGAVPTRRTPTSRSTPPARSGGSRAIPTRRPTRSSPPARSAPPRRSGGGTARSAPPSRGGGTTARSTRRPVRRGGGGG